MPIYNNISRRYFLKETALFIAASHLLASCANKKGYTGSIINDNSSTGHLLREELNLNPESTIEIPILIIGGGVSGLSAGYHLKKKGVTDYLILELADQVGGNSISGKNNTSAFPWAAHYLPVVNNSNSELLQFLFEHKIITGFDDQELPIYNDYYLCFDPEERLFIKGHWQDGLIPNFGVSEKEKEEIQRFFNLVTEYKKKIGNDGKPMFEIPLDLSSQDKEFRDLDLLSFQSFLTKLNFTSPHLLWYLNYCCKDDYGSTLSDTSAYAGLHYFCARRAKASNAESSAVLTWPEGNSFLTKKLLTASSDKIKTNQLITKINIVNDRVEVIVYNTQTKTCLRYRCNQVILCTPQYVNSHIISKELTYERKFAELFEYTPWIVANITLTDLPEHKGEPLSWDNVIFDSPSLGYVNACHQHLNTHNKNIVLTYYLPLVNGTSKETRKQLSEKKYEEICKQIINDLEKAHPKIEEFITNIDIKLWGHGMIKPKPNFIFNEKKEIYTQPIQNKIFFAHSDLSGISVFEEAFYQGNKAAKEILNIYDKNRKA
jgi:protoporphyrinogen oxidase